MTLAVWTSGRGTTSNGPRSKLIGVPADVAATPEAASDGRWLFAALFFAIVVAGNAALLSWFAWRPVVRPVLTLFLFVAAFAAHFMSVYGVVIDSAMVANVLQTDLRETRDLLNARLLLTVLVVAVLPSTWLWTLRLARQGWLREAAWAGAGGLAAIALLAALFFAFSAELSATMRNHRALRFMINPLNTVWAVGVNAYEHGRVHGGPPLPIGRDARLAPASPPPLLVFVVGETARADHFSLNGYGRDTNPELAQRDVLSFSAVTSCGTSTAASLPCMFSALGRADFEARRQDQENLLDLLQHAGMAVLWIDNQSGCKGVCDRVPAAQASVLPAKAAPLPAGWCRADGECYDEALLHGLDERLAALDPARRARGVAIFLHQMGSHGPAYAARSPVARKRFAPECATNVLQDCGPQELVNAFDDSIAYTDHVLARTIDWLQTKRRAYATGLLYVSDHGESLGENHLYLHGMPWAVAPDAQKHVPLVLWLSAELQRGRGIDLACLRARRDLPASHDALFSTVLGLVGVSAAEYRAERDLSAPCRAP